MPKDSNNLHICMTSKWFDTNAAASRARLEESIAESEVYCDRRKKATTNDRTYVKMR